MKATHENQFQINKDQLFAVMLHTLMRSSAPTSNTGTNSGKAYQHPVVKNEDVYKKFILLSKKVNYFNWRPISDS